MITRPQNREVVINYYITRGVNKPECSVCECMSELVVPRNSWTLQGFVEVKALENATATPTNTFPFLLLELIHSILS